MRTVLTKWATRPVSARRTKSGRRQLAIQTLEAREVPAAFVPGSIQGQDGWSGGTVPISAAVTQGVNQTGSLAHSGLGSWVVSNNTSLGNHNGAFGAWPFGPGLSVAAGQPSSGATANSFSATYYFRTAGTVADGSNIEVDLGTTAGDDRNTFMAITNRADADGGLQIRMAEPNPAGGAGAFFPTQIVATGLSRGTWHRIEIQAAFVNGASNDTFQVFLDGAPLTNLTPGSPNNSTPNWGTFEGYRDSLAMPYAQSNRLFFRSGGVPSAFGAFSDTAAAGFAFDNVAYRSFNSAAPGTTLASYGATFEAAGATTATVYVDDDWASVPFAADPDGTGPAIAMGFDAFATIQAGIDGVTPGGTVNVAAGTYPELVSVNKSVNLLGAQAGVDARTRTGVPESVVTGKLNPTTRTSAFYVTADNVIIDGFTSRDQTDQNQFNAGIVLANTSSGVTVRNNIISNNIIGLFAGSDGASTIERNLFDGNNQPGPAGGAGIYGEHTVGLTIDNNEFRNHNNNSAVVLAASAANAHLNLTFTNNNLHDNAGGVFTQGITGGLFRGNTIKTTGGSATALTFGGAVTGVDVLYNNLSGNLRALRIADFGFIPGSQPNSDIEAHFNDFSNSGADGAGIFSSAGDGYTGTLDLSGNWWGAVTGPTTTANPGGAGETLVNAYNDTIKFEPWLVYAPDGDANAPGVQLVTSFTVAAQTGPFTTTNNNYRRLVNVIDLLQDGQTVTLSGTFNWNEANAGADWAAGNDGVIGTGDDYSLVVRNNLNGVTLTASALGAATIQGPGDVAFVNLEGFLEFNGGDNQNWTISNLQILDFDLGLGFFNGAGGTDAFDNLKILNNRIRVPADLNATIAPSDVSQNIGIHYSFGRDITIQGNQIDLAGNGVSDGTNVSSSVGMQSNTSGAAYDGLLIDSNVLRVLDAQSASPARILGIWENGHGLNSDITVSNNQFLNLAAGNDPALNLQRAFRITSHSGATSTVSYTGNMVVGANIGFEWLAGQDFSTRQAVRLSENTITNSATGLLIQSKGAANLYRNTITGSGAGGGVNVLDGGRLTAAGAVTNAVEQNVIAGGSGDGIRIAAGAGPVGPVFNNNLGGNAGFGLNNQAALLVDASGNWWGTTTPAGVAGEVSGNVDFTPWLGAGTDTAGGSGFQGDFSILGVDDAGAQSGVIGRIQEAVNLVTAGGTVNVAAGTYAESVAVNKAVSILGAQDGVNPRDGRTTGDAAETVLQATNGSGITIGASGVTIGGLTMTAGTGAVHGVNEITPVTGTVVRDSFINGFTGGLGVAIAAGSTGFAVTGNELVNNYAGVYLSNTANAGTVEGNVIRDHSGASFTDAGSGIVLEGDNQNVTIVGNEITGNRHGVYVWTGVGGSDLTGTTVFNNAITGSTVAGVLNTNAATLNASGNWWGTTTAAGVAAAAGANVDFSPWLVTGTDADPLTGFDGDFSVLQVDDAGPQVGTVGRIQEAVNLVDAGGTVNVAAGTYAESVTVNKAVSLIGAQDGVNPRNGRTAGGAAETVLQATNGNGISITASGVTVGGLTVSAGTGAVNGIAETSAVTGTVVRDNFVHGFTGAIGVAIAAGSSGFAVTGNEIFNNYAGVYLSNTANAGTVEGNVIRDHTVSTGPDAGSGVVLEGDNQNVAITGNSISGNRHGIYVWNGVGGSDLSGTTVFNNAITGSTVAGVLNTNAAILNASGNWWGTATAAGVAAAAGAKVDFSPWLSAGTDADPLTGFDGDFSVLHVSAAGAQVGTDGRIAEAINLVDAGGTVNLAAGTFAENVTIGKNLTLDGDGATTIIDPVSGVGIAVNVPGGTVVIRDLRVTGASNPITATGLSVLTLSGLTLNGNTSTGTITNVDTVNLVTDPGTVNETIDITPTTVGVSGQTGFTYSGVDTLNVSAGAGDDTFNVIPSVDTAINVDGGPQGTADTLNVNALGLGSTTTPTQVLTDGRQPIGYTGIETVNVAKVILFNGDLFVTGTSGADKITVTMNPARTAVRVGINGVVAGVFPLADITGRMIINSLDGNDVVTVAANVPIGADITGGAGRDRLTGGRGHDRIDGGLDNDTVVGGFGDDTLVASGGKDVLSGRAGFDTVQGPDGTNAWRITGAGAGRLNTDIQFGQVENLVGGTGADTFTFRGVGSMLGAVTGGAGTDTLDYSALGSGVRVSLAGGFATRTGGVAGIENVTGGAGGDILVGDGGANVLTGNGGRDVLIGGDGADVLSGGVGEDILVGGRTTHDTSAAVLQSMLDEWRRPIGYATRVDHLVRERSGGLNGANVLTAGTVSDDPATTDSLTGGAGTDWFITFVGDTTDATAGETVTAL